MSQHVIPLDSEGEERVRNLGVGVFGESGIRARKCLEEEGSLRVWWWSVEMMGRGSQTEKSVAGGSVPPGMGTQRVLLGRPACNGVKGSSQDMKPQCITW